MKQITASDCAFLDLWPDRDVEELQEVSTPKAEVKVRLEPSVFQRLQRAQSAQPLAPRRDLYYIYFYDAIYASMILYIIPYRI